MISYFPLGLLLKVLAMRSPGGATHSM